MDLYRALFRLPLPVVEARILSWLGQEQQFLPDELPGNAAEVARESHIDVLQLELLLGYRGTRKRSVPDASVRWFLRISPAVTSSSNSSRQFT